MCEDDYFGWTLCFISCSCCLKTDSLMTVSAFVGTLKTQTDGALEVSHLTHAVLHWCSVVGAKEMDPIVLQTVGQLNIQ